MKLIETFSEEDRALIRRYRAGERTGEPAEAWKRYWMKGKEIREAKDGVNAAPQAATPKGEVGDE